MIKIEFKDGKEPLEIEAQTVFEAVQYAVKNRLDLRWAYLTGANLSRADLSGADLRGADLRGADLHGANLTYADFTDSNLRMADLRGADLRGADLSSADLTGANLQEANLRGADLTKVHLCLSDFTDANFDFACWPLFCGSLNVKIDKRIFCQLLYHTLRAGKSVDDPEVKRIFEIPEVVNLANQFHRVDECGEIELKGSGNATIHN